MVSADGAVVDDNIPSPKRNGVPLPMPVSICWIHDLLGTATATQRTFLTSNFFFSPPLPLTPSAFFAATGASLISTSAMFGVAGHRSGKALVSAADERVYERREAAEAPGDRSDGLCTSVSYQGPGGRPNPILSSTYSALARSPKQLTM